MVQDDDDGEQASRPDPRDAARQRKVPPSAPAASGSGPTKEDVILAIQDWLNIGRSDTAGIIGKLKKGLGINGQASPADFPKFLAKIAELKEKNTGIDVDGKPTDFATHADILYKDPHGLLCLDDWKSGDTDWGGEHVARSLQFGMMFMATQYGEAMLEGEWMALRETPHIRVVNVDALKPYTRRTMAKKDGEDYEYQKGDVRPETSVSREILITNESGIMEQFATKVRMARADLWPMNPTDRGCAACECRTHCPRWTNDEKETDDGTL